MAENDGAERSSHHGWIEAALLALDIGAFATAVAAVALGWILALAGATASLPTLGGIALGCVVVMFVLTIARS